MPRIQNIEQFQINLGKNKPDNQVKDVVVILVRTLLGTSGGLSLDSRYKGVCGTCAPWKACVVRIYLSVGSLFNMGREREINECNLNGTICVLWEKKNTRHFLHEQRRPLV